MCIRDSCAPNWAWDWRLPPGKGRGPRSPLSFPGDGFTWQERAEKIRTGLPLEKTLAFCTLSAYNSPYSREAEQTIELRQTISAGKRPMRPAEGVTLSGRKTVDGWRSGEARALRGGRRCKRKQSLRQKDRVFDFTPPKEAAGGGESLSYCKKRTQPKAASAFVC